MAPLHNFPPSHPCEVIHLARLCPKDLYSLAPRALPSPCLPPCCHPGSPLPPSRASVCLLLGTSSTFVALFSSLGWRVFWEREREGQVIYDLPCLKASFFLLFLSIVWVYISAFFLPSHSPLLLCNCLSCLRLAFIVWGSWLSAHI